MDAFLESVAGWHDFYVMVGTAAATLVGLLFVSLSLNVDAISGEENADLHALAAQTFTSFINVIMLSGRRTPLLCRPAGRLPRRRGHGAGVGQTRRGIGVMAGERFAAIYRPRR